MSTRWTQEQIFEDRGEDKVFGVGYSFKKSKVKIKGRKSKSFAYTFSILLVIFILLVANLTNNIIFASASVNSSLEVKSGRFYAISVSSFSSRELATQTSQEIKNLGGAGYLFLKDNKFYCLTSVYNKESSAISVCNKLINMDYSPEIIELVANNVNYDAYFSKVNESEKANLSDLLTIFDEGFEKFNYLSLGYDQHQLSATECKKEIFNFQNKFSPLHKKYLEYAESYDKKEVSILTQSLHNIFEKMEDFIEVVNENINFSSLLKNLLITISIARCELI